MNHKKYIAIILLYSIYNLILICRFLFFLRLRIDDPLSKYKQKKSYWWLPVFYFKCGSYLRGQQMNQPIRVHIWPCILYAKQEVSARLYAARCWGSALQHGSLRRERYDKIVPGWGEHVGLHCIKVLHEMGFRVNLCASVYPDKVTTLERVGIDVTDSIDGFVRAIPRNEILPFLGAYQRLCYSYFFFKKLIQVYCPDFVLVTGGSSLIPKSAAERTIIYVHFPVDIEVASERYINNRFKKAYIKPWQFISSNLDYIKKSALSYWKHTGFHYAYK